MGLKKIGLNIGHRRMGRLMCQNGISVVRTRKHMVTTDNNHKFNIALYLLDQNFTADAPTRTAAVETFFKTIKAKLICRDTCETRWLAEMTIFEYINGFYDPRRHHPSLGWISPVAFERLVA